METEALTQPGYQELCGTPERKKPVPMQGTGSHYAHYDYVKSFTLRLSSFPTSFTIADRSENCTQSSNIGFSV